MTDTGKNQKCFDSGILPNNITTKTLCLNTTKFVQSQSVKCWSKNNQFSLNELLNTTRCFIFNENARFCMLITRTIF